MSRRQVSLLIRPLLRALDVRAVAGIALAAFLVVVFRVERGASAIEALRLGSLFLAAGAAFAFDDAARVTLAAVPPPLWSRRALQAAMVCTPLAASWIASCVYAAMRAGGAGGGLPFLGLSLELAAMIALVIAVAAVIVTSGRDRPGLFAVSTPILLHFVLLLIPAKFSLLGAMPGSHEWLGERVRWLILLAGALAVIAGLTRDPARARRMNRSSRTPRQQGNA